SDVEIRVTLPAGSSAIVTQAVTAGPAGDSCEATGICTDLGDIEAAMTSCVHGVMFDANDEPMAGITAYSSAGTTAVTDQNGEFCLDAPSGVLVTVWCFGGTSVQVLTPDDADCPTGCAEVELRTVKVYDGMDVGYVVSSNRYYYDEEPSVFAQFALSASDEAMMSLGYFGLARSYGQFVESLVGTVDSYAVYESDEDYFGALFGCEVSGDLYDDELLYECVMANLGQVSALDPGAPGLAEFSSDRSADMLRHWDLFGAFGYYGRFDEEDYWNRLKALSYGQFVSANYLYGFEEPGNGQSGRQGPVDITWPGGMNIAAFTATLPGVPSTPLFTYPAFGGEEYDSDWWFDGNSDVTLTWDPQDPLTSLMIAFSSVEGESFFTILVWAGDDGSFTIPASAFANMPPNATYQQISATRLALETAPVLLTGQNGHGVLLLESHSDTVGATGVSNDFTLNWNMSVGKCKNNGPVKAAPANDNLANAQAISGASGSVDGTLKDATREDFELELEMQLPYLSATVWYTFTPPEDGNYQFDLSNWLLGMMMFNGDPSGPTYTTSGSSMYVFLEGGEEYSIRVGKPAYGNKNADCDPRVNLVPRVNLFPRAELFPRLIR
ncbi:MAG: hypothetical protein NTZ09_10460, partial [Candidatus Hydrogenedentes bacterium]|nr:hypothetical protein [Candidatus Hydrogenedentota bacterium]